MTKRVFLCKWRGYVTVSYNDSDQQSIQKKTTNDIEVKIIVAEEKWHDSLNTYHYGYGKGFRTYFSVSRTVS